jgi:uroporphyrinogen-III synthase
MISVLVVASEGEQLDGLAQRHPSVEVLTAHGVEETLEKLGRNRRIDAVLLLSGEDARAIVAAIEEDNPAHPPFFQPAGGQALPGTRILAAARPEELIDLLLGELRS